MGFLKFKIIFLKRFISDKINIITIRAIKLSFKDIDKKIKGFYTTTEDNLVDDFYNIVLSESVRYDRLSGYFRSSSLAVASLGIANFIKNNGNMRLLCGVYLTKEDAEAIKNADDLKNIVNRDFIEDYEKLEDELVKNHVKLLGWMVANGFLEIKIGIHRDGETYYRKGILHSKRGMLYDENNDCILFIGSANETYEGWALNIEDLIVDKSWKNMDKIWPTIKNFEKLWAGEEESLVVFDVPEASKQHLIKEAPKNEREVKEIIKKIEEKEKGDIGKELFPHQKEAIKKWFENDKNGIFEMATGTGKTFTSLKALERLYKEDKDILTVIACPFSSIINQWEKDIIDMNLGKTYNFYGTVNSNWRSDFDSLKLKIKLGINFEKPNIILTTHRTFSMEDFTNRIKDCEIKLCLIVDEMHHVGAKKYNEGILPEYDYKLGLSATPKKYMDYEGTENLIKQFDKIVFKFSMQEALLKINPKTGKKFLTPYNYHPIKIDLTDDELKRYENISESIRKSLFAKNKDDDSDNITSLFRKRRNIINDAENKYDSLRNILRKLDHKDHLIVFCSGKQIEKVLNILGDEGVSPKHRFTQSQKAGKKKGEMYSEKERLLMDFDKGECKALVAIKCLDEGVDVPSADQVIIMSSTTNPAEYIQRRGRVLRRYEGKEKAEIYDLCVIPEEDSKTADKITESEKKRMIEFAKIAKNNAHCIKLLKSWGIL